MGEDRLDCLEGAPSDEDAQAAEDAPEPEQSSGQ
jgi:hypothetical protein